MALTYCFGDNLLADAYAKEAAEALNTVYPNHSWWVECKQGVLIIKHTEASGVRACVGMLRKVEDLAHSAWFRKRDIIHAAGELLERAGLRRGARTDDPVTSFEFDDKKMKKHWHPQLALHRIIH